MLRIPQIFFLAVALSAWPLSASALVMDYTFSGTDVLSPTESYDISGNASIDITCTTTSCTLNSFSSSYNFGSDSFSFGTSDVATSLFSVDSFGGINWSLSTNSVFNPTQTADSSLSFWPSYFDPTSGGSATISITYDSESTGLIAYQLDTDYLQPQSPSGSTNTVPEPSAVLLLGLGLMILGINRFKSKG